MFNIPALGGTTAHALGAVLLAILVGPWAATLGMTLTLAIQALMFGDGGILSIGANAFNMAVVAPWVGYGLYRLSARSANPESFRSLVGAAIGAYAGSVSAATSAGVMLGIQPFIAHDLGGHALYCPFDLNITVPAMVLSHLLVAGPAESIITIATLSYLARSFPELLGTTGKDSPPIVKSTARMARAFGAVLLLTPLGLLATGSAWGEWDSEAIRNLVGYVPEGMRSSHELFPPLLPDYGIAGLTGPRSEIAGYLVSAAIGSLVIALFLWSTLGREAAPSASRSCVPTDRDRPPMWMYAPNPPLGAVHQESRVSLEKTVLKVRRVLSETIVHDRVARAPGVLQGLPASGKAMGFMAGLVVCALVQSPVFLGLLLSTTLVLAAISAVPMRVFLIRIGTSLLFFGPVVAIPVAIGSGSPTFSSYVAALTILLRISLGIALATLWTLTTRWNHLIQSLSRFGVPAPMLMATRLTYRYLFILLESLNDKVEARTARQVLGPSKRDIRTYAGAGTATLFAKSMALTEEAHLAMLARGFDIPTPVRPEPLSKGIRPFSLLAGFAVLAAFLLAGVFHAL